MLATLERLSWTAGGAYLAAGNMVPAAWCGFAVLVCLWGQYASRHS